MHDFPGTRSTSWEVVGLHVLLLLLVLTAFASVFWRARKPARWTDLLLWPFVAVAALAIQGIGQSLAVPEELPFLLGYCFFALAIVAVAMIVTAIRAWRGGQGVSVSLVVTMLGLLGLFIACLVPATPTARQAALRLQCTSNIKAIGTAIHSHHRVPQGEFEVAGGVGVNENGSPRYLPDDEGRPPTSWRVVLLPYLEQRELFEQYDLTLPWNDPKHDPIAKKPPHLYVCGAALRYSRTHGRNERGQFYTSYFALVGPGTLFPDRRRLQMPREEGGLSNTLMVVEACGEPVVWIEPRDIDVSRHSIDVNQGSSRRDRSPSILSSYHVGGAQGLRGDGSVDFINKNIDPQVLRALMNAAPGESKRD